MMMMMMSTQQQQLIAVAVAVACCESNQLCQWWGELSHSPHWYIAARIHPPAKRKNLVMISVWVRVRPTCKNRVGKFFPQLALTIQGRDVDGEMLQTVTQVCWSKQRAHVLICYVWAMHLY